MSKRHVGSLAALAALAVVAVTGDARAQVGEDDMYDRYGPEITVGGVTALGTERLYLVQPGDTLWDLSANFLEDAWMWPTLWALNPQVTNPHWIYPGDVLYIRPPSAAETTKSVVWADSRYNEAPRDIVLPVRNVGFIGTEEYQESGVLKYSREDKSTLGEYDEIYIDFSTARTVRTGEEYTIYRVEQEIEHPVTEDEIGKVVRFIGVVRVLDTSKPLVKAVILKSYEEIYRGDLLTEIFQHTRMLRPVQNTIEQDGLLLATFRDRTLLGEYQYVFIDKGTQNKVRTGNRFIIVESGDPYVDNRTDLDYDEDEDKDRLPEENIGEIMVVEPYESHSLGVVTRSIHELTPGMKIRQIDRY